MSDDLAQAWMQRVQARMQALVGPLEWLREQIQHDRVVAESYIRERIEDDISMQCGAVHEHLQLHDGAEVIADCDAKLAILDLHSPVKHLDDVRCTNCSYPSEMSGDPEGDPYPCRTVTLLASVYKNRVGFPPELLPDLA